MLLVPGSLELLMKPHITSINVHVYKLGEERQSGANFLVYGNFKVMVSHNTSAHSRVCINVQNVQLFEYLKLGYYLITDKSHKGKEGSCRDS